MLDGGLLDVDVRVFQSRVKIFSKLYFEGRDEGRFTFVASAEAPYGFCLNNEMSRFTVKTVSFSIETSADSPAPSDAPNADTELVPIQSSLNRIKGGLHTIEQEQSYYRVREHVHRNSTFPFRFPLALLFSAAESTNTRVYAWSLVETAILLLMSVGQILYLRRLFNNEHRSGFGRV